MPTTAKMLVKELQQYGFVIRSQRGSHIKLYNPKTKVTVIVPNHNKDLKKGLEIAIRDAVANGEREGKEK